MHYPIISGVHGVNLEISQVRNFAWHRSWNRSRIFKFDKMWDPDRIQIQRFGTVAELESENVTLATPDKH